MQEGIEVLPVHVRVGAACRRSILVTVRRGILRLEIDDDADLMLTTRAVRLHCRGVRPQQMMRRDRRLEHVAVAGCQHAIQIAAVRDHPRFVERRPHLHAVVQLLVHHLRVLGEPLRTVGIEPATAVVEHGREIPVVQRHVRRDPRREQRVDESIVEAQPGPVDPSAAMRQHAAPGDAEPIRIQAELAHQRDVLCITTVVIAGDVPGLPVRRSTRRMRKTMPNARPGAVRQGRPFDLIRRGRGTPEKALGKSYHRFLGAAVMTRENNSWRA